MRYPHIKQHDEKDCGAACLSMISEFYGLKLSIAKFRELIKVDNQGASIYGMVSGAEKIGFNADALEGNTDELIEGINNQDIEFPFIARIVNEDRFQHFIVVYGIKKNKVIVGDPGKQQINKIELELFFNQWQGQIITFKPNENFKQENQRKGSLSKFFKLITNQKKLLVFIFIVSLLISFINIFSSQVFEYIIDDALSVTEAIPNEEDDDHDHEHEEIQVGEADPLDIIVEKFNEKLAVIFNNIDTVCISAIFLFTLRGVLQIIRGYILSVTAKNIDIPLTLGYYDHLIDLPLEFYGTRKTGELMSRFSDTAKIRDAVSTATLTIMLDTLMAVLTGIYLFTISAALFAVSLITMLVYSVIVFIFRKPIKYVNYDIMENNAQVDSYLKESVDGIETVKSYQYESSAKTKTETLFKKLVNNVVKGSVMYNIQDVLVSTVASLGIVILLWIGTYFCLNDIITLGELISFYYLLSYFFDPVSNLVDLQPTLQTAVVASERLNDVLDAEIENNAGKKDIYDTIENIQFKNVSFRYGNRDLVLQNINMEIKKGQKIAIIGESGCGKTTLVKLLMSFYKPEKGKILINGSNLQDYSLKSVRKNISYISQNIFLFSDTVYSNLRMGNENISNEKIQEICKLCYADEFIQKLPLKYDTVLDENGDNLSGGQKQRLALARALLREPDILIMDEATGNLDTITEESIIKTIESLSENMTLIVIAHRLKTIKNCDYIYVMNKGRIIEKGTHEELIDKKGLYFKYNNI